MTTTACAIALLAGAAATGAGVLLAQWLARYQTGLQDVGLQ